MMMNNDRTSKKWLDAQSEQNTIQRTFPAFISLVDLKNDDYFKLVVVEIPQSIRSDDKPKLKVYKGTTLVSEQNLPGIPSSLKSFYVDDSDPKLPGKFTFLLKKSQSQIHISFGEIWEHSRIKTMKIWFFAVIAVAIGPAVYFYKNMKPFFKYTFPSLKIDPLEKEIWRKV